MRKYLILVFTMVALVLLCGQAGGRELVVTTTADSGPGSLRWALLVARPGDVITFDPTIFPPDAPATIYPLTELPPITCGGVTIDASNAGVIIDGSKVPGDWNNGLQVYSGQNAIMGLCIINFKGSGIAICGDNARYNIVGGDREIGGSSIGQGNCIYGNGIGIDLCDGAAFNRVVGNYIGVFTNDGNSMGNFTYGIWIEDRCHHNTIGPENRIVFNGWCGVAVTGRTAICNKITKNVIYGNGGGATQIFVSSGGNSEIKPPGVAETDFLTGYVRGTTCPGCEVEIYSTDKFGARSFEGTTSADQNGVFVFKKGAPLDYSLVTAVATDQEGNSSEFTIPVDTRSASSGIQGTGSRGRSPLFAKESYQLEDNRIGTFWHDLCDPCDYESFVEREITRQGVRWAHMAFNSVDSSGVNWQCPEDKISPCQEGLVNSVVDAGAEIMFILTFWDKATYAREGKVSFPRFKTESQIRRYVDFVRNMVRHFKGRIRYYELWNEPTIKNTIQWIEVEDYIRVAKRVIPIIREEDPEAKIVIGATDYLLFEESQEYLFRLLNCDLPALVDGISWHPMFGTSPQYDFHRDYYYNYPDIVRRIKATAFQHGFHGEFFAQELTWRTEETKVPDLPWPHVYTDIVAAKYLARGVMVNLGLNAAVTHGGGAIFFYKMPASLAVVKNLCTIMAGHEAIDMPVEIDIDYEGPVAYCSFRYPDGDRMLAIWTDGIAQDDDLGVPATIEFPGLVASSVTGIDVLNGFQQELVFQVEGDTTVVRDVLVKDYPILIRLSDVSFSPDYSETAGDGFHRFGDVNAIFGESSGGSDRDGDGVPDDQDYCPDWPGSKESNGC